MSNHPTQLSVRPASKTILAVAVVSLAATVAAQNARFAAVSETIRDRGRAIQIISARRAEP